MTVLDVADNPKFQGQTPRLLKPSCHDCTPFLDVHCPCGFVLHLHESQLAGMPTGFWIVTRCHDCKRTLELAGDDVRAAFQQMRDDGWLA